MVFQSKSNSCLHEASSEIDFNDSNNSTMQVDLEACATSKQQSLLEEQTKDETRGIRFAEYMQVAEIPHLKDWSSVERDARWLNKEEFNQLQVENELTELALKNEEQKYLVDDEILCARGVFDMEELQARKECNSFIQKLVLSQYAFFTQKGLSDVTIMVSKVYSDCAAPAAKKAYELALQDAEDAKELFAQTKDGVTSNYK
jgi:hypothetical protein